MSRRKIKGGLLHGPFLRRGAHSWRRTAMTPLPAVFRKGGFELTMVKRAGRAAIYRQHLPAGNPDHDAYEVILPQVHNTNHEGQPVEPYEGYPAAESWGKKGWTFTALAKAVQKLKRLAKPSPAGTVSRKNRFEGQTRIRSRLTANASRFVAATRRRALTVGQRQTLLQRKVRLSSGRYPVPTPQRNTQSI
jgi:hypothetical protein